MSLRGGGWGQYKRLGGKKTRSRLRKTKRGKIRKLGEKYRWYTGYNMIHYQASTSTSRQVMFGKVQDHMVTYDQTSIISSTIVSDIR